MIPLVRFHLRRHRLLLLALLLLFVLHEVLLVYVFRFWKEQVELSSLLARLIPGRIKDASPFPLRDLTDPATFRGLVFLRPDRRALHLAFAIAVGSDAIAGEAGRRTADLLFSHPVRRRTAVFAAAAVIAVQALALGAVMVGAYALATTLFPMGPRQPSLARLVPCAVNLAAATLAIGSTALLAGSFCASRARAVLLAVLLVAGPILLDFVGLFSRTAGAVARIFPEHYYRPHTLLLAPEHTGLAQTLAPLALITAVSLLLAAWVAERRDL